MKLTDNTSLKLSANFSLEEFVISQAAERFGYDNRPNEEAIQNLKSLCENILQPLRGIILIPILINSGYRSFVVNAAVGGKFNSQHLEGKAADFIVPNMNLYDVFNVVYRELIYDQLIFEFGKWIHVSWNWEKNRKEALMSKRLYGRIVYETISQELK